MALSDGRSILRLCAAVGALVSAGALLQGCDDGDTSSPPDIATPPPTNSSGSPPVSGKYDVVIVGAGFGGSYAGYLLSKYAPDKKVLILEKDSKEGGKLQGPVCRPGFNFCQEFGAMRLMKDLTIPELKDEFDLLQEMELTLVEVPYDAKGNFWYYKGKNYTDDYTAVEGGPTPGQIIEEVKEDYLDEYPIKCANNTWKVGCNPNVLQRHDVIDMSVPDFFKHRGATWDEYLLWQSEMGYNFYNENVSAASWLNMGKLHSVNADRSIQFFLKESWLALPQRLLQKSGVEVRFHTEVTQVSNPADRSECNVEVATVKGAAPDKLCADSVILTTPFGMPKIDTLSEDRKSAIANAAVHYSHFKAFLTWDEEDVWWTKLGLTAGKSTTDLTIRQVHYYSKDTLLVYAGCCEPADILGAKMESNKSAGERFMFEQIKEMHAHLSNEPIPEPDWSKTVWKWFKGDGTSKWRNGVNQEVAMDLILNGEADKSGIFMASDVFSEFPAWIVGNMMSVRKALNIMYGVTAHK